MTPLTLPQLSDVPDANLRRAALLLHSMCAFDRGWLLDQLGTGDRDRLAVLLSELQELGLPADPSLVADALAREAAPPSPATATASIVQALLREPDGLIVDLLRCGPWDWQSALFSAFPPARRRSIEAALRTAASEPPLAPARRDALVNGLLERARAAPMTQAQGRTPSQSVWQRLRSRLGGQHSRNLA